MKEICYYNGYTALTKESIKEELNALNKSDYEPDILILRTLIKINGFNVSDEDFFDLIYSNIVYGDDE